jgi:hypothetical protein
MVCNAFLLHDGSRILFGVFRSTIRAFLTTKEKNFIMASLAAYFVVGLANSFCLDDTVDIQPLAWGE